MTKLVTETRFDAEVDIVVHDGPPLATIARESAHASFCFIGLALEKRETRDDPLAEYAPLVEAVKGHIVLCKNWQDLHPEVSEE